MGRHRVLAPFGSKYKMVGASVAGPAHIQQGMPNQDALYVATGRGYALAIVCDGMGSAVRGKEGANAAVQSVAEAIRIWMEANALEIDRLLKLIHQIWNIKVEKWGGRESATTCLFAMIRDDGSGFLARLGDGLILASMAEAGVLRLAEEKHGFANETRALGTVTDLKHWQITKFDNFHKGDCIMLCTDGISEDIQPEQQLGFMQFLMKNYATSFTWRVNRKLERELRNWPTDKHSDDKTICLIWK